MIKKSDLYWEEIVVLNEFEEVLPFEQKEKISVEDAMKGFNLYKKEIEECFNNQEKFFPKIDAYLKPINETPNHPKHNAINCASIEDVEIIIWLQKVLGVTISFF